MKKHPSALASECRRKRTHDSSLTGKTQKTPPLGLEIPARRVPEKEWAFGIKSFIPYSLEADRCGDLHGHELASFQKNSQRPRLILR
jgi:hypothetical protein